MSDFYALADLKIDELNILTINRFETVKRRLRKQKYDTLIVTQLITALYQQLDADTRYELYLLADEQYDTFAQELGVEELDEGFEDLFLENILSKPDPITRYTYDTEILRKRDRAIEGINAVTGTLKKQFELDKAMRFFSQMQQQYIDNVAYEAAIKAFKDAGVKYVRWVTQKDDKVCADCEAKDGKIYPIDNIPQRPHWRCRCECIPLSK